MTSDTRDIQTTEQPASRGDRVQLSAVQVAASALASVSAAVVASLFGVAGTVVGAGVIAIVSTTGSALYSASMKRTSDQLRRAREQLLTARAGSDGRTRRARSGSTAVLDQPGGGRRGNRDRTIDLTDGADKTGQLQADEKTQSWWRRGWLTIGSRKGLKWPALVGAAVLVFAIAIGVITAVEAITQKPIAALTGHSTSSSTTVGSLTGNSNSSPSPAPSPTNPGGRSGIDNSPAPQVSVTPTSRTGNGSGGSDQTSTSSPQPSAAPSSAAPQTTSGTSNNGGSGTDSGSGSGSQDIQVPAP